MTHEWFAGEVADAPFDGRRVLVQELLHLRAQCALGDRGARALIRLHGDAATLPSLNGALTARASPTARRRMRAECLMPLTKGTRPGLER